MRNVGNKTRRTFGSSRGGGLLEAVAALAVLSGGLMFLIPALLSSARLARHQNEARQRTALFSSAWRAGLREKGQWSVGSASADAILKRCQARIRESVVEDPGFEESFLTAVIFELTCPDRAGEESTERWFLGVKTGSG